MLKKTIAFGSLLVVLSLLLIGITQWIPLMTSGVVTKNYEIENTEGNVIRLSVYEQGENLVVLAHGFSSEKTSLVWVRNHLLNAGYSVAMFDFTGHGGSQGQVNFDNAQTERLSNDLETVVNWLISSGYEASKMQLYGHSMGGRAILQYASRSDITFEQLYLVGPEVNLIPNLQASFFTGADDLSMPFADRLSGSSPKSPITIVASTWDDIHTIEASQALYNRLTEGEVIFPRKMVQVNGIIHKYEIYSNTVLKAITNETNPLLALWYVIMLGILFIPIIWYQLIRSKTPVIRQKESLKKQVLYWVLAVVFAAILLGLSMILPFRKPYFSMQFVVLIGGFGIAYWLFNLKLFKACLNQPIKNKIATSIAFLSLLIAQYTVKFTAIQSFQLNPDFVFWSIVFVALSSIGFLAIQQQANNLMKYFPFYMFFALYLILGSLSGIVTTAEGILFLIYSIYGAKVVYAYSHNEGLSALLMGLMLGIPFGAFF
jgi:pimeloyl-ACP methyl ester carboxylesterase